MTDRLELALKRLDADLLLLEAGHVSYAKVGITKSLEEIRRITGSLREELAAIWLAYHEQKSTGNPCNWVSPTILRWMRLLEISHCEL